MTSRASFWLAIPVAAFGMLLSTAWAELPPGSYDKLRAEAEDAIIIEVSSVTAKAINAGWTEVVVTAKVLSIERSARALKKGATVTIRYESRDPAKVKIPGPRPIPVLKPGEICPAFLNRNVGRGDFEPAAYGLSFVMTPEG
jgi:hypothetical protein